MSEKDILYIIIPAYNEADNILNVINDWYPVVEKHNGNQKSRLVIIDDESKDDTYNIISAAAETRPLLHPVKKRTPGTVELYYMDISMQSQTMPIMFFRQILMVKRWLQNLKDFGRTAATMTWSLDGEREGRTDFQGCLSQRL